MRNNLDFLKKKHRNILLFLYLTIIPLVGMIISSVMDEMIFFYFAAIIYPIYLGIIVGYYYIRNIVGYDYLLKALGLSIIINYFYNLIYYIYKQRQFDEFCKLNNQPLDLDGFIPFFLILTMNFFIFIVLLMGLVGLVIVIKLIKNKKTDD